MRDQTQIVLPFTWTEQGSILENLKRPDNGLKQLIDLSGVETWFYKPEHIVAAKLEEHQTGSHSLVLYIKTYSREIRQHDIGLGALKDRADQKTFGLAALAGMAPPTKKASN
ncbi:MAG: hypothetical protein WA324_26310 [Bryobacteraceae bacterium]